MGLSAGQTLTLESTKRCIDAYLAADGLKLAQSSRRTYRTGLREYLEWAALEGGNVVFTEGNVREYYAYLTYVRGLKGHTIATYMTALRGFCEYLVRSKEIKENPTRTVVARPRMASSARELLTTEEVAALTRATDALTRPYAGLSAPVTEVLALIAARDQSIIQCMMRGGLTARDVVRAKMEDLDETIMGLFLKAPQRGHSGRRLLLPDPAHTPLARYIRWRGTPLDPDAPVWISHGRKGSLPSMNPRTIRERITAVLSNAGLTRPGVTPHSLTQTALLLWIRSETAWPELRERMREETLRQRIADLQARGLVPRKFRAG